MKDVVKAASGARLDIFPACCPGFVHYVREDHDSHPRPANRSGTCPGYGYPKDFHFLAGAQEVRHDDDSNVTGGKLLVPMPTSGFHI